ncbi:YajQ family cyclic di-GMP-binding protein [Candidatus Peregrinibacteria bacterium]|nr:YajQ family cyclic di-GMP-binding protein [Candidatus Peregrinibacteria bacterium]
MSSEHSMDIVVKFDFQEMRNAIDQAKKEILNRYDLKDSKIEIELAEDAIKINSETENQMDAIYTVILKKMIGRNLSPKILEKGKIEPAGGMRFRQEIKLIKVLDQENAKKITKIIRDRLPKIKTSIQGETVRTTSKSIDELQEVIKLLEADESLKVPLSFTNYR